MARTEQEIYEMWNASECAQDAADKLGMKKPSLQAQVSKMRNKGWECKHMPRGPRKPVGVAVPLDSEQKEVDAMLDALAGHDEKPVEPAYEARRVKAVKSNQSIDQLRELLDSVLTSKTELVRVAAYSAVKAACESYDEDIVKAAVHAVFEALGAGHE